MEEFIMFGVVIAVPLGIAILLLTGKLSAADAIAGFNTMSKKQQAKYDEKALSCFMGWLLVVFCLGLFLLLIAGKYFKGGWIQYFGIVLILSLFVGCFYVRTSKRFRKNKDK